MYRDADGGISPKEVSIKVKKLKQQTKGHHTDKPVDLHTSVAVMEMPEIPYEQMGKVLWESARLYQILFESVNEGLLVVDAETMRIILCNQLAATTFGFDSPEDAFGVNPLDFVHPEDQERALKTIIEDMFNKNLKQPNEFRTISKYGKELWVSAVGTRIDYRGELLGLISFRDITARKIAEEELRESKEKLRLIFESIGDGIIVTDLTGRIVEANESSVHLHGYSSKEELTGQNGADFIAERDRPSAVEVLKETFVSGRRGQLEYTALDKDGKEYDGEATAAVLRDNSDNPAGLIFVERDVTERKQAEEQLRRTVEDLERSNAELQQFAYVASHDLQEPLRMIASYVELLEEDYADKLDADAKEFIQYAVEGATRMQAMIQALLEYSRVGTRGKPLEPTDCGEVLDRVLRDLQLSIEENEAVVTHDSLPTIPIDDMQIGQLFQNLISNAIKFRNEEPPHVQITAKEQGENWLLSVHDNGIGIDPEYQDRIFVIFQRLHEREEYPGTGIGLSVCKKIVERHGGKIWVESEVGKGSIFHFTIPKRGARQ
jgi:PAS domain S-box-containing protein